MIEFITGDLFNTDCLMICHQVNCQGVMGSGVAKQVKEKYPKAYNMYLGKYHQALETIVSNVDNDIKEGHILLGTIQLVNCGNKVICNMFSQNEYIRNAKDTNRRFTDYEAFYKCLEQIKNKVSNQISIAFPYHIGCDRGGANWEIILTMISQVLCDYNIKIYCLEDNKNNYE